MNSRERRKVNAEKHNMARIETEAYKQDRIEQPDKYWKPKKNHMSSLAIYMVAMGGMGY